MGAEVGVGKADEFIGTFWRGWKQAKEEVRMVQVNLHFFDWFGGFMGFLFLFGRSRCILACLDRIICCMLPMRDLC
ncbi:hypothetical protein DFH29DRAFT_939703 [Suillus ampliporus]|nr:hypothetical protein DFH29DRAFT_939703 [Suillus ampliporus]